MPNKKDFDFTQSLFEITINPDNRHQYFNDPLRHIRSREDIKKLFESMTYIKYWLYQEISIQPHSNSELPKNRVHYHGIIEVNNHFQFALVGMNRIAQHNDYQLNNYRSDGQFIEYSRKQSWMYKKHHVPQVCTNVHIEYMQNLISQHKQPLDDSDKGEEDGSSALALSRADEEYDSPAETK